MVSAAPSPDTVMERIAEYLGRRAARDAPLGARTTYRVGGSAALLVEADDMEALADCHRAIAEAGVPVPVLVIGRGSNMLVSDSGFPGLAICLSGEFGATRISGTKVTAGGAVGLQALARETASGGLGGFEWAVGIPGSVGGAVRMNAGGHGSEMADVVIRARLFDLESGTERWCALEELRFGYRHSSVTNAQVVLGVELKLEPRDPSTALEKVAEVVRWRVANQPGGLNAGSVFKNPPGDSAGRLIDAAGLKGLRIGSAEVSDKHANFFQSDRHGSADDLRALVDEVRRVVRETQGVDLVPELRLVGFPGDRGALVEASTSGSGSVPVRTSGGGLDFDAGTPAERRP